MFATLAQYRCSEAFSEPWQYILFMNDLWEALRHNKDVAAQVVAEGARARPTYRGPARTVVESLGRAYAKARGASIWGEKTPGHLVWLPQMHKLFPDARIVLTLRDPRDIVLSYDDWWGQGQRNTEYLMQACAQVRHYLQYLLHPLPYPSDQVALVRYESLVSHPDDVIKNLCTFLNVPFEPTMLEFYRTQDIAQDARHSEHHVLLHRPVTSKRIGRYRFAFSRTQVQLIEQFLRDEMRAHGYELESEGRSALTREEKLCLERALKRYELMRRGSVRRRILLRARLRLLVFRWLTTMAPWAFSRLATTSAQWETRIDGLRPFGEPRVQPVSLRQEH
jgi:hypothetical protein